jgi:hypothetical protein
MPKLLRSMARWSWISLLPILFASSLPAQHTPPDSEHFTAILLKFEQQQSAEWQNKLKAIAIEDLPISYREGKVINQNRDVALRNYQLAVKLAQRILSQGSGLSDDINLMATLADANNGMHETASMLVNSGITDNANAKKVIDWSQSLEDVTNGPANALYIAIYQHVTARADELETHSCASK